jgi:hypothetical protein
MQKLAKAAEAQAWGSLGASTAYILGRIPAIKVGIPASQAELAGIGYVCAAAAYIILSRSLFATNRCLTIAKLLFVSERITKKEYDQSRRNCLKKSGLL